MTAGARRLVRIKHPVMSVAAENRAELFRRQAAHGLESFAEVTLVRKARDGGNFCNVLCCCCKLARCYLDSPLADVLPDTAAVTPVKNASEMHGVDADNTRDPLDR